MLNMNMVKAAWQVICPDIIAGPHMRVYCHNVRGYSVDKLATVQLVQAASSSKSSDSLVQWVGRMY